MVCKFSSDDPEGVVDGVLVDLDLGQTRRRAAGHPFLVHIVVRHDVRPGTTYWHLAEKHNAILLTQKEVKVVVIFLH